MQTAIDRKSYSLADDLRAQGGGGVADALRNVPSVEVDLQGNVSLRGDPNVTILIDGKPSSQFEGDNRALALQSMPASSIERVEVITNPSAEFRSEGTGGVINLITKKARGAGATGSLRATAGDGRRYVLSVSGGRQFAEAEPDRRTWLRQDTGKNDSRRRPPAASRRGPLFVAIDQHDGQRPDRRHAAAAAPTTT